VNNGRYRSPGSLGLSRRERHLCLCLRADAGLGRRTSSWWLCEGGSKLGGCPDFYSWQEIREKAKSPAVVKSKRVEERRSRAKLRSLETINAGARYKLHCFRVRSTHLPSGFRFSFPPCFLSPPLLSRAAQGFSALYWENHAKTEKIIIYFFCFNTPSE